MNREIAYCENENCNNEKTVYKDELKEIARYYRGKIVDYDLVCPECYEQYSNHEEGGVPFLRLHQKGIKF